MEKEFIPYEQALELKELGFDEECLGHYKTIKGGIMTSFFIEQPPIDESGGVFITKAPLYQQASRWFREKYGLVCYVKYDSGIFEAVTDGGYYSKFNTFQEAELACLKKLIEVVKTK
jgi:hypothetical protein